MKLDIANAEYKGDYRILVTFENGEDRTIDLKSYLESSSHPLVRRFLDIDQFKEFHLDYGTICWGDNEFDLDPVKVYDGAFS
jgi:hypothetical protein